MFYTFLPTLIRAHFLIEQINILLIMIISVLIFAVLVLLGVRKFFRIKTKNNRLIKSGNLQSKDDNNLYKNFTEGHLYDSY